MTLFAPTLASLLNRYNITREELAEHIGVSPELIYDYLSGYLEPDDEILFKLTGFFGLPCSYLTGIPSSVAEPFKPGTDARRLLVPVVTTSKATNTFIKESDILDTISLSLPRNLIKAEFLALKLENDTVIGDHALSAGDNVMVSMTNQLANNDAVAFCKRSKPVEFRRFERIGPVITLYSYEGKEPIEFHAGSSEYRILGVVRSFEIHI